MVGLRAKAGAIGTSGQFEEFLTFSFCTTRERATAGSACVKYRASWL